MSKLERLLNLTAALLETPRLLTADEIRRRVPGYPEGDVAFKRAFERDKDDLREMGVPLVLRTVQGSDPPVDGYRIPKDQYYLRDPGLEPDELAALHLAASAVRLDGLEGIEALWKLGGVVSDDGTARPVASLPTSPSLPALFAAVAEQRPVRFRYHSEERRVDPYRLDFARGRWYLSGYDHLREDERQYRLDRIEGPVDLGQPGGFDRPSTAVPGARLAPWQLGGDGEAVTARLLVDADQAPWAVHHLGEGAVVERRGDGSVELAVVVSNRPAFRSFVLSFLEHAEVLGPPELRDELVAWLEQLCPG